MPLCSAHFDWKPVNLEIYADDLFAAVFEMATGALAQLGKAHVRQLAKFESYGDQHRIHIDATLPFKLKQHVDGACIAGPATQYPASAAKNGSSQGLYQSRGVFHCRGPHLQGPRRIQARSRPGQAHWIHPLLIGPTCEILDCCAGVRRDCPEAGQYRHPCQPIACVPV